MKTLFVAVLGALLLSGCAERYFSGPGAEALVYPETHIYQFTVKSTQQTEEKLNMIFDTVDEIDSGASYLVEYRSNKGKKVVYKSLEDKTALRLRADEFVVRQNSSLSNDIQLTITYHALVTHQCAPSEIEEVNVSRNCFSEVARMKQVSHKEHIVEGL